MVALVGLCRDGGDHAWMVPDLDRPNRHGLGTPESYGNSLGRAAGSCEPGRGLSGVPKDYERVLPMVSSGLVVNADVSCYRDVVPCRFGRQLVKKPTQPSPRRFVYRLNLPPGIAS